MLREARLHQVSRARMAAIYGGSALALVGFAADSAFGLAPLGLVFVAAAMVLTMAATLHGGRSLASRIVGGLIVAMAVGGLVLAAAAVLVFALSDFTLVIQGAGSSVQVSDGIGTMAALTVVGLAALLFGAGLLCARLVTPARVGLSRLFDAIDRLAGRREVNRAAGQLAGPAHQGFDDPQS